MMTNITYGTFLLFGTSLVVGTVFIYLVLPETKGLSLEEMDILFSQKGFAVSQRQETDRIISEERRKDGHELAVSGEKRHRRSDSVVEAV